MSAPDFKHPTIIKSLPHTCFIQDERSLVRIGFFAAREDRKGSPPFMRSYTIPMYINGIRSVQNIVLESTRGLPSTADRGKWYAFVRIAQRQRDAHGGHGVISNPIRFTGAEFLHEQGVCDSGRNYDEILLWGERMAHTNISARAVIYFSSSDTYSDDDTLHVFDRFKRLKQVTKRTSSTRRASRTEMYEVYLADWLLENLNSDFTIPEDLTAYKKLVRPIAASIFPLLTWWFSSNGCQEFKKNYTDLCLLLGITRLEYLAQITRALRDSLAELIAIGYLSRWQIQKNEEGTDYNLVLWPGLAVIQSVKSMPARIRSGAKLLENQNGEAEENIEDEPVDAEEVVAVLQKQGIYKDAALQLLKEYDPGKIIDFAEFMAERVANDDQKIIKNAAGLLIHLLRKGDPIPPGFISSRVRRKLEAEKNNAFDQRIHSQTQEVEFVSWREEQVEREVDLRYPGEAYQSRLAEVIAQEKKSSKTFAALMPNQQANLAASQLRKQVREAMTLPTLDMWCATHSQYALFLSN